MGVRIHNEVRPPTRGSHPLLCGAVRCFQAAETIKVRSAGQAGTISQDTPPGGLRRGRQPDGNIRAIEGGGVFFEQERPRPILTFYGWTMLLPVLFP